MTGCTGQINGSLDLHSKLCDIFTQHDVTNQAGREADSKTVGLTVNDWSVIAAAAATTAPDWLATHTLRLNSDLSMLVFTLQFVT